MKKYKCHEIVEAGKIVSMATERRPDGDTRIVFADGSEIKVPSKTFAKGTPCLGEYLIRYEDGYLSWSSAKTFEAGYSLLEEQN